VKVNKRLDAYSYMVCEWFRRDGRWTIDRMPRGDYQLCLNGRKISRHQTLRRAKSAVMLRQLPDGFAAGGYSRALDLCEACDAVHIADLLTWEGQAEL